MTPNKPLAPGVPRRENSDEYCPIWTLTEAELKHFQVTPLSMFYDLVWKRPVTTPGMVQSICNINWRMDLLDGSRLVDAQHAQRLGWSRKLTSALLHAPSDGLGPAEASMAPIQQGFKWLLSWMAEHGYHRPDELTPDVIRHYVDDLPRFITEQQDDDEIGEGAVVNALRILRYLWSERHVLAKWGVPSLRFDPFYEKGMVGYAKEIATKARGWIKPLPDEVAIPLFNKAAWFLGAPAEDVIRLLDVVRDPLAGVEIMVATPQSKTGMRRQKPGEQSPARLNRAKRFLATFPFSVVPGEAALWHDSLDDAYESKSDIAPHVRVRQLVEAVREACAITIQGTTGMRISELMGIEAGLDEATGLPKGVRIEETATGLYDLFLIRTVLSKTEKGLPREVDWVLGMRPKGATEEPLAVHALRLLNRLYEPWREHATTHRLILTGLIGEKLPLKTTALGAMTSDKMRLGMKRFTARWVDLSGLPDESAHKTADNDLVPWRESKGGIISSHMLRKSWAQYVFAVDPRLLPAIQLQFHHMSQAMTESFYIGANVLIVTTMNSVATQQRNLLIFETILGKAPLAGKMGEQIEEATRALAAELKGLPTSDAWQRTVRFCDDNDLKIFFNPYGKCISLMTSRMRCHEEAGTPLGLRVQPNPATRQPSLCVGCDCFVLDQRHAPFWEDRYLQNWIAFKKAERMGNTGQFLVIKERASQAGKLLRKIGIKVELLDKQIERALVEDHVAA